MTKSRFVALAAASAAALLSSASAFAQSGPVASACSEEIAKYCADKEHGRGEVRACLEANKDKASSACKTALATTGPGKGMGMGPGMGGAAPR